MLHWYMSREMANFVPISVETKKTVEKETVTTEIKEVKETVIPEEEKWDMLAKYENIPRNEFTTRECVFKSLFTQPVSHTHLQKEI